MTNVYSRREALTNLSPTIEGAFRQTLERIREHKRADRALRILSWLYLLGPITSQGLRYILSIEPHHTQFQPDNLPSPSTFLDCCLGLAKLYKTERFTSPHTAVTFVHSTLRMHFDSNPQIVQNVIPSLLGICFACLSFPSSSLPLEIRRFAESVWVPLLYAYESQSDELAQAAWDRCLAVNSILNTYKPEALLQSPPLKIPGKLKPLLGNEPDSESVRSKEQLIFHTACMLGLGGWGPVLNRLSAFIERLPEDEAKGFISGLDCFGISPLGWILLPENDSSLPWGSQSSLMSRFDSFEHNLWKAGELFEAFPELDPGHSLWDLPAMKALRFFEVAYPDGTRLSCVSNTAIMFLFGNHSAAPDAVHKCVAVMQSRLKFDFWSVLRPQLTDTGHLWGLVTFWAMGLPSFWEAKGADQVTEPGEEEEEEEKDEEKDWFTLDGMDEALPPLNHYPEAPDTHYDDVDDPMDEWYGETRETTSPSRLRPLFVTPSGRRVTALFEPGIDIPVLLTTDARSREVTIYMKSRSDVTIVPFPASIPRITGISACLHHTALLHVAAYLDNAEILRFVVLKYKLDPNMLDPQGRSALQIAITNSNPSATFFLIDHPDTNLALEDSEGLPPLHFCVRNRKWAFASAILRRYHGNIDQQDLAGKTPMHYAAEAGERNLVRKLLQLQANADVQDNGGRTALHWAIIKRDTAVCEMILKTTPPSGGISARNLQKALSLAIDAGAKFIIAVMGLTRDMPQPLLLLEDVSSSASSSHSRRPEVKALRVLLAAGKSASYTEKDLDFMLRLVSGGGGGGGNGRRVASSSAPALALQRSDLPIWVPDPVRTIRSALVKGAENVAVYLLRTFPIDLGRVGENGESVLHLATVYNAPQVIHLLLTHHREAIDISHPDPEGYAAPQLAVVHMRLEILQILLDITISEPAAAAAFGCVHERTGATVLTLAVKRRFVEALPLLLACPHVDVNRRDGSGRGAIHQAVLQQDLATVELLVRCPRVDILLLSGDGRSVLAYAALCARKDMMSLLLDTKVFNLDHADGYGKTALDWAKMNTCEAVATMLRDAGGIADQRFPTHHMKKGLRDPTRSLLKPP